MTIQPPCQPKCPSPPAIPLTPSPKVSPKVPLEPWPPLVTCLKMTILVEIPCCQLEMTTSLSELLTQTKQRHVRYRPARTTYQPEAWAPQQQHHDTCKHIELLHYTSLKLSTTISDGEVVGGVAIADASLTILPRHVKLIQGLIKKRKTSKSGLTWPSSSPPFPQYWPSLCLYQTIPDTHTSLEKVWQEKTLTKE